MQNYTFRVNIKSLERENSPLDCGDLSVFGIHFRLQHDAVEERGEECRNIKYNVHASQSQLDGKWTGTRRKVEKKFSVPTLID